MRKMVKKLFGTMLAVCLLSGCLSGVVSAEKTYVNEEQWGFETDWDLYGGAEKDKHVFYDLDAEGDRSLRIVGEAEKTLGVWKGYTEIAESSGKTQYVIGKIKADLDEGSKLVVSLRYGAVTDARIIQSCKYTFAEECDWTDIYLASDSQYNATMYVTIFLTGTGTVYADDFNLVEDDESMTYNPTFLPAGNQVSAWSVGRGKWGLDWNYDTQYGALRYTKKDSWPYLGMYAPYSNRMQAGEIYKISIRYKALVNDNPSDRKPDIQIANGDGLFKSDGWENLQSTFSAVNGPDTDGFIQYVTYYTMPEGKTNKGFIIQGAGSGTDYFDDFYVVKDETSAPYVEDASGNDTIEAGETVTAKMHLAEKEETNVQLVIAVYSKVGGAIMLEAVNIAPFTVTGAKDISVSVTAPSENKEYTAKAFCWDADNMLTPLP